jgi:branched-chain amino acid transport system substrate-binding protein
MSRYARTRPFARPTAPRAWNALYLRAPVLSTLAQTEPYWTALAVLLALLALALGGCAGARSPAEERVTRAARGDGDVVIAVAWPWEARRDVRFGDGLQLALDQINAEGGVRGRHVRLVRYDDRESVDEGRLVAQRIAADAQVVAVIGHLQSYVSVPAAAIYDLAGVVMIAPAATDPELTARGYPRVFRATFTDRAVGHRMAEFAAARGYRRLAIYYIRNVYGRDLANAFEERATELGLDVASRHSYDASGEVTGQTFEPTLRAWRSLDLDAVFVAGEVPSAAVLVSEVRKAGLAVALLGGDAMSSPGLLTGAGAAAEGAVVASAFHPDEPREAVRRFARAFRARYGADPDVGSAVGYDALRVLVAAMREARSTVPDQVAAALRGLREWPGVTGPFTFDAAGDRVGMTPVHMEVRRGRFEYLAAPTLARAEAAP